MECPAGLGAMPDERAEGTLWEVYQDIFQQLGTACLPLLGGIGESLYNHLYLQKLDAHCPFKYTSASCFMCLVSMAHTIILDCYNISLLLAKRQPANPAAMVLLL